MLVDRPYVSTTLGIGVGGDIIQHIEADTTNPRMWDLANSRILYIQILNSLAFKTLTGLNPPHAPISAVTYTRMKLPFFEEWSEQPRGKSVHANGVFDKLRSVASVRTHNAKDKIAELPMPEEVEYGSDPGGEEEPLVFPLVLIDVDDTFPWFRSAVGAGG